MLKTKIIFLSLSVLFIGAACTPISIDRRAGGGVWVSTNKGESWDKRVNVYTDRTSQKTIGSANVEKMFFSPSDKRKIFAITKAKGLWFSWNGGHHWDLLLPSISINDIAVSPDNPKRVYAAVGGSIAVSENEGVNWKSVYVSDTQDRKITSIVLDPSNPSTVYASVNNNTILVSNDNGVSWHFYTELDKGAVLKDMRFHPHQEGVMYAINENGGLAKSEDKGKNWIFFDIEGVGRDYELIKSGVLYASTGGIYRSLNFGKDWTKLPLISGKDGANIYAITANPKDPSEIFYGTKSTIYHSVDGGFNWVPRLAPSAWTANELTIHPDEPQTIYLGTSIIR